SAQGPRSGYLRVAFAPDGRTLAAARQDQTLQLWDVATGKELWSGTGFEAAAYCLAFRPDGKALGSGHADSTILLWDLTAGVRKAEAAAKVLKPADLAQLWSALAGAEAPKAYQAILALAAAPAQALPFLQEKLRPVAAADPQRLRQLLDDLDSAQFARRP